MSTELEEPRRLGVSVDDVGWARAVDVVTDRRAVNDMVTVIVPTVSVIALGIPEQMLYTLISSTASLLGQAETRH
jgi:hypothetical protein